MKARKVGTIKLTYDLWRRESRTIEMFEYLGMLPLKVVHDLSTDIVYITGISEHFDEIEAAVIIPEYIVNFSKMDDGKLNFSVDRLT